MERFILVSGQEMENTLNLETYQSIDFNQNQNNSPKAQVTRWLLDNFETFDSATLPRSAVYKLYENFCRATSLECFNSASFGKLIRTVFPTIKTRRLGTRGKSKYHYYGIQIKATSELVDVNNTPIQELPPVKHKLSGKKRKKMREQEQEQNMIKVISLPSFVVPEGHKLREHPEIDFFNNFLILYHEHCEALINVVLEYVDPVEKMEDIIHTFYANSPFSGLFRYTDFGEFVIEKNEILYGVLLHLFVPNVLQTVSPSVNNGREFSRKFSRWIDTITCGSDDNYRNRAMSNSHLFCSRLYTQCTINSLSHIFQQILHTEELTQQMIVDHQSTDFYFLSAKASTVLNINVKPLEPLLAQILEGLQEPYTIEKWVNGFEHMIHTFLDQWHEESAEPAAVISSLSGFLSILMNDLTVRNAESFGSFHILRSLFEEFVQYFFDREEAGYLGFDNSLPHGVAVRSEVPEEPMVKHLAISWPDIDTENGTSTANATFLPSQQDKIDQSTMNQLGFQDYVHQTTTMNNSNNSSHNVPHPHTTMDMNEIRLKPTNEYYFPIENIQRNSPFQFNGGELVDSPNSFIESPSMPLMTNASPSIPALIPSKHLPRNHPNQTN